MIQRNEFCWCGSGKKWKKCHFPKPPPKNTSSLAQEYLKRYQIIVKTPEEIDKIRIAGHAAARILDGLKEYVKPGTTTLELDQIAQKLYKKEHAIAATLGYSHPPYPKSICTSLNEVICHGIPDETRLKEGDILNIDVTAIVNGYFGDCSKMFIVGKTTPEKQHVVDVAYTCLMKSIEPLKPGVLLSEIGRIIEEYAHQQKCSVVDQFVAHGVGRFFHEGPQILHCKNKLDIPLIPGMTFTIEPMINLGRKEGIVDPHDHWTVRTVDNKASAQWEHTLLITETGVEILTPWKL